MFWVYYFSLSRPGCQYPLINYLVQQLELNFNTVIWQIQRFVSKLCMISEMDWQISNLWKKKNQKLITVRLFDRKIHTIDMLLLFLGPVQKFCLKIVKELKDTKIESCQNCQNWKLSKLTIAKVIKNWKSLSW